MTGPRIFNPDLEPGELQEAIDQLLQLLRPEELILLSSLMLDVIHSTGWGDIKIVIADGEPRQIKIEKSHKFKKD